MRTRFRIQWAIFLCLFCITCLNTGCVSRTMSRVYGKKVAGCTGKIKLEDRGTTRFAFEIFHRNDGSFVSYFKTGHFGRFRTVEDLSFDNGELSIEVGSPRHTYEGALLLDSLTFEGDIGQLKGIFSSGRRN